MQGGDGFQGGETIECLKAFFAAVAGFTYAAKRKFNATTGAIIVDKDLPGTDCFGGTHLTGAGICPDRGDKAKVGRISDRNGLFFGVKGDDNLHRPENLVACKGVVGGNACQQCWRDIVAAARCIGDDFTPCGGFKIAALIKKTGDDGFLVARD
jgi:hypothetical protein